MDNKSYIEAMHCLQKVFTTPDGEKLLEYLNKVYVDRSCFCDTVEKTHYALGQKEFVETLIRSKDMDLREVESRHQQYTNVEGI